MVLTIFVLWFVVTVARVTLAIARWSLTASIWTVFYAARGVDWCWRAYRRRRRRRSRPRDAATGNTTTEPEHAPLSLLPLDDDKHGSNDRDRD